MAFSDEVTDGVTELLKTAWDIRNGEVVPETEKVTLKNGAVKLQATYLYADLAQSSHLAHRVKREIAAKVIRSYIQAASRILLHFDGAVRSFDGDRVMAIFVGSSKNTHAVRAALAINWAYDKVIWPKVKEKWPKITDKYQMSHGVGVATGEALIVRGGVRKNNDLISVGGPPNVAAKLSELRKKGQLYIVSAVYNHMHDSVKYHQVTKRNMWSEYGSVAVGGTLYKVYRSGYVRKPT